MTEITDSTELNPIEDDVPLKTYEIVTQGSYGNKAERFQVTVPESWKVTFGPVSPGVKGVGEIALRFYESDTKQRAVFRDVHSFRDLSIGYKKVVVTKNVATKSRQDSRGNSTLEESIEIEEEYS